MWMFANGGSYNGYANGNSFEPRDCPWDTEPFYFKWMKANQDRADH